jgi:chromosome segregation ATPase
LKSSGAGISRRATVDSSNTRLEQNIKSLEQDKQKLTDQQNATLRELTKCRTELDNLVASRQTAEREMKSLKLELDAVHSGRQKEQAIHQQAMTELKNLKIRMESTSGRVDEYEDVIKMYKGRSEDLQDKLEEAELSAHNAMRSESYAREQLREVESALASVLNEQKRGEEMVVSLQRELRSLEAKVCSYYRHSKRSLRTLQLS